MSTGNLQSGQNTGPTSAMTTGEKSATALGDTLYLDSSGELFAGTTSVAKGVTSASQVGYDNQNGVYMDYVTDAGDVYILYWKAGDATGTSIKVTSGFKNATALADKMMFLTSDGKLYNGTQLVDSNVTSASQIEYDSTNGFYMNDVRSSNSSC